MNAAVESSRLENQRRRPRSSGQKRGGLGDSNAEPLAVLIRVPNLDAPRPAARSATRPETKSESQTRNETSTGASTRVSTGAATTTGTAPIPSTTSHLVGWAWRLLILSAAVGLVLLAYRIINGPATSPELEAMPTGENVAAESSDANNSPSDSLTPPTVSAAPQASDIAAPSTLGPPQLEFESPPIPDSPVDVDATAGAPRSAPHDDEIEPASHPPHDERRPWATASDMEQAGGDGSVRTARSEWNEGRNGYAGDGESHQPKEQQNPYYENWDENTPNYDYPETSPDTWRDDGRWESTPRTGPPQHQGAAPPAWDANAHSAMRQHEPGVARLRGQIEQPPLRRDDERNRPGIY